MKKNILIFAAIVLVLTLTVWTVSKVTSASSSISIEIINLEEPIPHESGIECLGPISTKLALVIDGEVNNLLCTFDDPFTACENVKKEIPELLAFLQEGYDLPEFSYDTWMEYSAALNIINRLPDYDPDLLVPQEIFFGRFRDIIENDQSNTEIIVYARNKSKLDLEVLASMLPYTDPLCVALEKAGNPEYHAAA